MTEVIFYVFAAILLFAGLRVVTAKNPVHAALYLVLSFFNGAALWMLMQAEFLAVSLIVVYVGAVMVLFLFVVMMLDINFEELRKGFWKYVPVAGTVAVVMAVEMALILSHRAAQIEGAGLVDHPAGYNNAKVLGQLIYTEYFLPFQLAAVLLLVGMIAAIALTLRKRKNTKYINPANQIQVKRNDRVKIVSMPAEERPSVEAPKADDGQA
ncbi:NADH-quinone oxidoreductase subunit J [Jeongeupia chitinilytica]|uniref:NADH-quinone oxidoreductase subunit J n=1 Tax=Jeongeupia chitinilytica TaxID=1041641 RepID=A0ABQ3GXL9_9NEIS|nr:NADH-quinone oxidoreductase subunit J [Jeongeupia chitinilytica]GHD55914.1 NADH:ubiquinone oxidoreductase subunit J [Jeongeupia chitinilytica]